MSDLTSRIADLTDAQRELLSRRLDSMNVGPLRLVGYVTPAAGVEPRLEAIQAHLSERLPTYMIPSDLVVLEEMPRTTSGKIDRRSLPLPRRRTQAPAGDEPGDGELVLAPRNPTEALLKDIWADVLGFDEIGVHDNFFELGGDSIMSIHVASRAGQEGLRLSVRMLVDHPTIAELAERVTAADSGAAEEHAQAGPVPLTPIQRWFWEQDFDRPERWNQYLALTCKGHVDVEALRGALEAVVNHHDALRLRFARGEDGWAQETVARSTFPLEELDRAAADDVASATAAALDALQGGLDLTDGPVGQAALVDFGPGRQRRLLFAVHHLAVDTMSWPVLLGDLQTAYEQLVRGEPVSLPAVSTSFAEWSRALVEHCEAGRAVDDYWRGWPDEIPAVPLDHPDGTNDEASAETVTVTLDADHTSALVNEAQAAYSTRIDDLLVTALMRAYHGWSERRAVILGLEGHGRESVIDGVDVARTVGWFTAYYPVHLTLEDDDQPGAIKSIKEQLRRVPERGTGFGVSRYLAKDASLSIDPQLLFNYTGSSDQMLSDSSMFSIEVPVSVSHAPTQRRPIAIEINSMVVRGELTVHFTFSRNLHDRPRIERLAAAYVAELSALVDHCLTDDAGGYTPSDFPDAGLDQSALDAFLEDLS